MSAKALKYAEDTLGVHTVHEDVQKLLDQLDEAVGELDKAQDVRRKLDEEYADREVELVHEMRGVHPNMSDTRFKSEYKGWEREDDKLKTVRRGLFEARSDIQGLEYDIDIMRFRIKAGCARMEQLGGYLHYLAAVKASASKPKSDDPWKP